VKARSIAVLALVLVVMAVVILVFVVPGITKNDAHMKANLLFNQGAACDLKGDTACAIDFYQKAIALYGEDSKYYVFLAQAQTEQGNYTEALKNYLKAKDLDPSNEAIMPEVTRMAARQASGSASSAANPPGNVALPEALFPIFDEEFGVVREPFAVSESPQDQITWEVTGEDAYTGSHSLKIGWNKMYQEWASIVLAFDPARIPPQAAGPNGTINLSPPSDYAVLFFARRMYPFDPYRGLMLVFDSLIFKFQDRNVLIKESGGNQVVYNYLLDPDWRGNQAGYVYKLDPNKGFIVDGHIPLPVEGWQEICLPLSRFKTDYWINDVDYKNLPEQERQFDWTSVAQINLDAGFFTVNSGVYVDALRIVRASDCTPFPP
jgi:Tetratricopeptide repeat